MFGTYLPLITSCLAFVTALVVAWIGYKNSQSAESKKIEASYLNFALQSIMAEYSNNNPVVNLTDIPKDEIVRAFESKYEQLQSGIMRVAPLLDQESLAELEVLADKRQKILTEQFNQKLNDTPQERVNADEYVQLLSDYIQRAHGIMKEKVTLLRKELEQGLSG